MKNIVLGIFCLLFSFAVFLVTLQFPDAEASYKDPAVYPVLLLVLIVLIGIILIVQGIFTHRQGFSEQIVDFRSTRLPRLIIVMTVAYVLIIQIIGFIFSTFIYLFLLFTLFGGSRRQGMLFSGALTLVEYGLFVWALRVRLPEPIFHLAARLL